MLASHRDGKYIEAIEKITGQKLARREMMDIEVREESRTRRDDRGAKGGRGRERGRGRDGKQHDRRPPGGKFHDQVASMEPTEATASPVQTEAPVQVPRPEVQQPVPQAKRHQDKPHQDKPHQDKPRQDRHEKRPQHEKRERGNQRQHNEQAARSEVVDKSDLPAFLFRPVPVKKPDPQ